MDSGHRGYLALGGVVAAVWLIAMFTTTQSTLWDRDEARYGTAALEMVATGNVLYPIFNGELRAFQPALIYWLMSASVQAFGPSEFAVRFPSTLALVGISLLCGLIAIELGAGRDGWLAALIAGTSPMLFVVGTAATTDAVLTAWILVAQWVLVRAWVGGSRRWHLPVMSLAIGCALLTKGPLGLLVPLLSLGAALALARGRSEAGGTASILALSSLLGTGIFLAWGLPANSATDGDYWRIAVVERLPQRLFTAMEGHGGGDLVSYLLHLPFYPVVLLVGFLPWTMYLPQAWIGIGRSADGPVRNVSGSRTGRPRSFERGDGWARSPAGLRVLLFSMVVPLLLLMTLIVSKLPHYVVPVVPWLAVLVALRCGAAGGTRLSGAWLRALIALLGAFSIALVVLPWIWQTLTPLRLAGGVLGTGAVLVLVGVVHFLRQGRVETAAGVQGFGMLAGFCLIATLVLPRVEEIAKPGQRLAVDAAREIGSSTVLASLGWNEPGMHFYMGGRPLRRLVDAEELGEWVAQPGPKALLTTRNETIQIGGVLGGFREVATSSGIDHVSGGKVDLVALLRD